MSCEYENAFAQATGGRHAVMRLQQREPAAIVSVAVMALDLRPGDAAIVPTLTFLARQPMLVRMTGAEVVFDDVDADTGLM